MSIQPPSEKPSTSSIPISDLISVLSSIGVLRLEAGKLHEPEPFTGEDPKKLRAFIFQCTLYFHGSSGFEDDITKVNFTLSYLQGTAQQWFEPAISGLYRNPLAYLSDWKLFVDELRKNFGSFNEVGDAKHKLTSLH